MRMNSLDGGLYTAPPRGGQETIREEVQRAYSPYTGHNPPRIRNSDDFPQPGVRLSGKDFIYRINIRTIGANDE